MTGVVSALILRIFSNPFSNVLQKHLTQTGCRPFCVNFFTYAGLSLFCLLFLGGINFFKLSPVVWSFAVLGGIFGTLGNGFLIKALERGDLSLLGPINSYKSVAAMFFGIIFLKEIPTLAGILGIILVIYGSYFIFDTQKEGFSFAILKRRDIQYRILALIFTAIEAVFIKNVILHSSIIVSFVFWCWFGALFSGILLVADEKKLTVCKTNFKELILLMITTGVMQLSTNYVFNNMNVSYALALFQLSTILSVVFGWKFFDEKHIKKKLLGSFIMLIGAVMLILMK